MRAAAGLPVALIATLVGCKSPPSTAPAAAPEPATSDADAKNASKNAPEAVAAAPEASEPTSPAATACKRDGDCTLSTFAGCCTCCPGPARAFFKPELARLEAKCQAVRCGSCDQVCPPAADLRTYSALCESGRCVAEPH